MNNEYLDILHATEIFSTLQLDKLLEICEALEPIQLIAGEVLFTQGAPSDSLYIVAKGSLAIKLNLPTSEVKDIGVVHRGQTIGETGLLASQPRGMTVIALRPSKLLKLTKSSFESLFPAESKIFLNVIELIVKRSKKTIKMLHNTYDYRGHIFLPAKDKIHFEQFVQTLKDNKPNHLDIVFLSISDLIKTQKKPMQIFQYLNNLEKIHEHIFYFADVLDEQILEVLFEHADRLIIVGSGDTPAEIGDAQKQILINQQFTFSKINLLLLYEETSTPQYTTEWLRIQSFSNYYHIHTTRSNDYARLFRYLAGNPIGLVLGGGGTRGWIHIGVIKALLEEKIEIDLVGGTSVGSLVAALFLLHPDYDQLIETCHDLFEKFKNPLSLKNFVYPIISLTSGKKGSYLLDQQFHEQLIENLPKPYFCISSCVQEARQIIHTQGLLKKWIRASSSVPGIVPPIIDNRKLHVDGGVLNFLPVDVMRDLMENKGKIIAVDPSTNVPEEDYNFPPTINFWESILIKLKRKKYILPELHNFLETSIALGSVERTISNGKLADVLIKPHLLDFPHFSYIKDYNKLIQIGYDAMKSNIHRIKPS